MGLDMYLTARKHFLKEDDKLPPTEFNLLNFKPSSIVYDVGYWRKANAIHNWFVENIQDGDDNCKEYYVSRDKLNELLELCKEVLAEPKKAEELLPTCSGFFFGDTGYDEYYFEDIKKTIEIITNLLKIKEDFVDFYYQSSW